MEEMNQNNEEEVTEFQLESEVVSNKENIQNFAHITIIDKPSSPVLNVSNSNLEESNLLSKKSRNCLYNSPSMYHISHMNSNSGPSQIYSRHPSTNAVVPSNTSANVSPFNCYDSVSQETKSPERKSKLNLSNINIGNSYYDRENSYILTINIKVSNDETLSFNIRRYDNIFKTVKIFCEINNLDAKFIRPFILYIIKALNRIYGIVNLNLTKDEILFLNGIKDTY